MATRRKAGRPTKYPWEALKVGECFTIVEGSVAPQTPYRLIERQNRINALRGNEKRYTLDWQQGQPRGLWRIWRMR